MGVPVDGLHVLSWLNKRWEFHDTDLSSYVDAAFHAVSIDERRGPFRPTLWTQPPTAPKDQVVQQVWFSGVHCDVGGGNDKHELSDIPLLWMADRARDCGLRFTDGAFETCVNIDSEEMTAEQSRRQLICTAPDLEGEFEDSRKGFYRWLAPFPRVLGRATNGHESVASSAVTRYRRRRGYAPDGLVEYLRRGDHHETEVDVNSAGAERIEEIRV